MGFLPQPITLQTFFGAARKIGELDVQVVVNESTNDTLTITKQPVQQGASITDHAYKEPTTFSCTIYFQDNITKSLSKIYQELLDLQESRQPFTITTPKRIYRDMLISVIAMTTDKNTENCLKIDLSCQQIIIVSVSTVSVDKSVQKQPKATAATQKVGKKSSFLATGRDAIVGLAR